MRVVIAGGPRVGKSTFALELSKVKSLALRSTDDLMKLDWHRVSDEVARWFDESGPWVIEGVRTIHALRKWLQTHPEGKPCDVVFWMDHERCQLTSGQTTMARGCKTIWDEIRECLEERKIPCIRHFDGIRI